MGMTATQLWTGDARPLIECGARKMPNAAWAWEFLRRNPDYARDFRAAGRLPRRYLTLRSGARFYRPRRRYRNMEKWGLLHPADPDVGPFEADVFWSPDLLAGALNVRLSPLFANDEAQDDNDHDIIVLSAIQSRRVLLDATSGARHILMNGERFWIQLVCEPPLPVGEIAEIRIRIDGAAHGNRKLDTAAQLLSLHRSAGGQLSLIGRNCNAEKLERALLAYDIWHGSEKPHGRYRKIAEAIFGVARVAEEWNHPSQYLFGQARRAKQKGERYVAGDYKKLLFKKAI